MKYVWFILITCLASCTNDSYKKTGFEGKPMPVVSILLEDSVTHLDLTKATDDKPVMIFYFGADCPYSQTQIQRIEDHKEAFENYKIFAITTWPIADMKSFAQKFKLKSMPNITIGMDYKDVIASYYSLEGVPFTAFYDKKRDLERAYLGLFQVDPALSRMK